MLDHDGSVTHAAVLLPLPITRRTSGTKLSTQDDLFVKSDSVCLSAKAGSGQCDSDLAGSYPYILSLHGTGLSAMNQADAYKEMPTGSKNYIFGVPGFFVIAPGRRGAHNWEVCVTR